MKENSRIRFNPVTKEIEVEGSEKFVKTYFDKIQAMLSGTPEKKVAIKKEPKPVKASPAKKAKKEPKAAKPLPAKKAKKVAKKKPGVKRVTNIDMITGLIQGSAEGISTAELKEKTGLAERQIWGIVNHAAKLGKIKKEKRGLYVGA
jgi:predicted Zn-dependent peptidase